MVTMTDETQTLLGSETENVECPREEIPPSLEASLCELSVFNKKRQCAKYITVGLLKDLCMNERSTCAAHMMNDKMFSKKKMPQKNKLCLWFCYNLNY